MKKIIVLGIIILGIMAIVGTGSSLAFGSLALAEETSSGNPPTVTMPSIPKPDLLPGPDEASGAQDVQHYFRNKAIPSFTARFIALIGGMAIIALVWSGIRFIGAGGEEEAITSAKKTATWAVAGFAIAILSYAIVSIVSSIQYPNEATPGGAPAEESVIYKNN